MVTTNSDLADMGAYDSLPMPPSDYWSELALSSKMPISGELYVSNSPLRLQGLRTTAPVAAVCNLRILDLAKGMKQARRPSFRQLRLSSCSFYPLTAITILTSANSEGQQGVAGPSSSRKPVRTPGSAREGKATRNEDSEPTYVGKGKGRAF